MLVKNQNKSRANYTEHEHAHYYANRECKHQPISGARDPGLLHRKVRKKCIKRLWGTERRISIPTVPIERK